MLQFEQEKQKKAREDEERRKKEAEDQQKVTPVGNVTINYFRLCQKSKSKLENNVNVKNKKKKESKNFPRIINGNALLGKKKQEKEKKHYKLKNVKRRMKIML